ncbi:MAG: hypothetical protein MI749_00065, partial [Desulfovibrionales bacterium]|nr:hypothetical protein [Desulfovibrionales bacterium]
MQPIISAHIKCFCFYLYFYLSIINIIYYIMKKRARRRRKRGPDQKSITGRGMQIAESRLMPDLGSGRYKISSQPVPGAFYDVT